MYPFDEEDDELNPKDTVNPTPALNNDQVRQMVMKKYGIAQDRSSVDAARSEATKNQNMANILQGVEGIFRAKGQAYGGQGVNSGLYDSLRNQAVQKAKDAESDRKDNIGSVLQEHELDRTFDADERSAADFSNKQKEYNEDTDFNSSRSKATREYYKKTFPTLGLDKLEGFDQLSAAEIKQNMFEPLKMKEQINARQEEARQRAADRSAMMAANRATKEEAVIDRQVEKAADKLGPLQDLNNSLDAVEGQLGFKLEDYDTKNQTVNGQKKDLPGVSIPGYGRVSAYSTDGRQLKGSLDRIFNTELKARSGAAVTTPEMDRLRDEFNAGKYNTESEMIGALQRYKALAIQAMKNHEAGFKPEAIKEYENRGGQTSNTRTPKQSSKPKTVIQNGHTYILNEETGEYE